MEILEGNDRLKKFQKNQKGSWEMSNVVDKVKVDEHIGKWVKSDYIGFVCSVCGKQIVGWATKQCPHCKSKMTIGKGDEA